MSPVGATGDFSGVGNTTGFIEDISQSVQPLNTLFSSTGWITFAAEPNLFMDLQFIPLGVGTPSTNCAGIFSCTPQNNLLISPNNPLGLSAFNLGPGSASFQVQGIAYSGASATGSTPFVGTISLNVEGLTPAEIVTLIYSGDVMTYSADFVVTPTSPVPEPTSLLLLGTGLVGAGARRWRNRRRQTA